MKKDASIPKAQVLFNHLNDHMGWQISNKSEILKPRAMLPDQASLIVKLGAESRNIKIAPISKHQSIEPPITNLRLNEKSASVVDARSVDSNLVKRPIIKFELPKMPNFLDMLNKPTKQAESPIAKMVALKR